MIGAKFSLLPNFSCLKLSQKPSSIWSQMVEIIKFSLVHSELRYLIHGQFLSEHAGYMGNSFLGEELHGA